eukprot:3528335-Pyramimonas_sp.AAC.2
MGSGLKSLNRNKGNAFAWAKLVKTLSSAAGSRGTFESHGSSRRRCLTSLILLKGWCVLHAIGRRALSSWKTETQGAPLLRFRLLVFSHILHLKDKYLKSFDVSEERSCSRTYATPNPKTPPPGS